MHPSAVAFRRAQRLLADRAGAVWLARALGVLDALCVLGLFVLGGLLLALFLTRGNVVLTPAESAVAPSWVAGQIPKTVMGDLFLTDTGLYPVVAHNLGESAPPP